MAIDGARDHADRRRQDGAGLGLTKPVGELCDGALNRVGDAISDIGRSDRARGWMNRATGNTAVAQFDGDAAKASG
jgi:hypothetical protein